MGCVNCGKSGAQSTPSAPTGNVVTGNVIWDGTSFTCPNNPALNTILNDNLNTVLLRLLNDACSSSGCCFNTTTYTTLTTMITNSTLTPGALYMFPYQTIHNIDNNAATAVYNSQIDASIGLPAQTFTSTAVYDEGQGVLSGFNAEVENLIVRATSANTIALEAWSVEYPNDVIYYDHTMNLTEDGVVSRPGFIVFRHDTDRDVSAWFDWRNVLHRRYEMDQNLDRDAEYDLFVKANAASQISFSRTVGYYSATIPAVVPYAVSGNTNLGGLITAVTGSFRDYKTFPRYNENPDIVHENIHIKKVNESTPILTGSGFSNSLTTGQFNGTIIPNVVLLGKGVVNVTIGHSASGVHIAAQLIKNIEIGNEVQNISLGGFAGSRLTGIGGGYLQDVKIGNMSRDIHLGDYQTSIEIGVGNIGVWSSFTCERIKIGDNNTFVFFSSVMNFEVGGANRNIFAESCSSLEVGSGNNDCRFKFTSGLKGLTPAFDFNFVNTQLTPGFESPLSTFPLRSSGSGEKSSIKDNNKNVYVHNAQAIKIGSGSKNIIGALLENITIGDTCDTVHIYNCSDVSIGELCWFMDISLSYYVRIGYSCTKISVYNTKDVKIEQGSATCAITNALNDINIGKNCNDINIHVGNGSVKIGDFCSAISLRNASDVFIASNSNNCYLENAFNISIGETSTNIVCAPLGCRYMVDWPDREFYRITDAPDVLAAYATLPNVYSTTIFVTQGTIFQGGVSAAFPSAGGPTSKVNIGNNANAIYVVSSIGINVGDNCTNISFGTHQLYGIATTQTYTAGVLDAFDDAYVIANGLFVGKNANFNTVKEGCEEIRIVGPHGTAVNGVFAYEGNTFGENVKGIYTDGSTPFSLRNTSILLRRRITDGTGSDNLDLGTLTLTQSYQGKVFDRRSNDGELWEQTISTGGVLAAPTKLV